MVGRLDLCMCLFIVLGTATLNAANDWPQFRGPTGQGISSAVDVPVEWNAAKNIAWKMTIAGRGWSSPVYSDGKLYLTSAVGPADGPISLAALCVDASTGKLLWTTDVLKPDPGLVSKMHQKNSPASATPIISGDRLYVHFGPLGTAALDLSGKILWTQTSIQFSPVHGNGGSPVLYHDTLIFTCDGASDPFIAAIDARDGAIKWKTPRNTPAHKPFSFCTPLVIEIGGTTQAIIPGSGFVGGYDPSDGREIWRVRYGEGFSVVPRPVFAHGLLFVSSGFDSPVIYAINPAGAQGDVTKANTAWTRTRGAPCTPSMLVAGDNLYVVSDGGIATCVDAITGNVNWTHRLDGNFSASPICAQGRIYFQSEEGIGYVIKAGKTFESVAENDLGERTLASYAMTDGAIFIRGEHHLWKISSKK